MDYEIKVSESGKYIVVIVNSDMTKELAEQVGKEAIHVSKKKNINLFLYDLRNSVNKESVNSNYIFANQDINRIQPDHSNRIAMLTSPKDKSHNFVETVLRNAGHNVLIFSDKVKALEWLLEETEML
ncbi:MAG: hypothetical protein IPJ23_13910 [Ignavibacteriales bacterium]|nr:hypothetical protein [Ignavibacteriales bacterium]